MPPFLPNSFTQLLLCNYMACYYLCIQYMIRVWEGVPPSREVRNVLIFNALIEPNFDTVV